MSDVATEPAADAPAAGRRRKSSRLDAFRHLIGKVPDAEVAQRAGVTSSGVAKYRRTHGIPAAPAGAAANRAESDPEARATDDDPLPPEPGEEAPKRGRRGPPPPRRTSRLDAFREHIGVMTDREVAELAGLTRNAVQMYRRKHNIPPAQPPGAAARPSRAAQPAAPAATPPKAAGGPGRRSRIDAFRHLVGKVSDREVADQAGVTVNAVQLYRKKHGIAPAPRGAAARLAETPAPAPTATAPRPAAAAAAPASGRLFGWRLRLEGPGGEELVRIVVAPDATAACAAAAPVGTTVAVERIGEAIG